MLLRFIIIIIFDHKSDSLTTTPPSHLGVTKSRPIALGKIVLKFSSVQLQNLFHAVL